MNRKLFGTLTLFGTNEITPRQVGSKGWAEPSGFERLPACLPACVPTYLPAFLPQCTITSCPGAAVQLLSGLVESPVVEFRPLYCVLQRYAMRRPYD
jgi:hypothetical protein